MPPPLRTSVTAWSAISCAFSLDSGESTTSPILSRSTRRLRSSPTRSLAARILSTLSWIRWRVRRPLATAAVTAFTAASGSAGISSTSAPASSALTAASPVEKLLTMPAISSASVTTMPWKPRSFFNKSVRIGAESVAGIPGGESDGTATCAVITASTPEAIAVHGDGGHVHVAVHRRVAVSRKVFHRGQRVVLLVAVRSFDEGLHFRRHGLGILPERPDIDDRIIRVIIDIGHGIENPMNPQRARLPRRHLAL